MNQLTLQQYQKLAKKLNSWLGAEKAKQKLIQYTRQNPLQAINYTLRTLQQQENKKLLELITTTILEILLDIPPETAQKYTAKYLEKQPQILQTLLKDIMTLAHENKLQQNKNVIQQEILTYRLPVTLHLLSKRFVDNNVIIHTLKQLISESKIKKLAPSKILGKINSAVSSFSWSLDEKYVVIHSHINDIMVDLSKSSVNLIKNRAYLISLSPKNKYYIMSPNGGIIYTFNLTDELIWVKNLRDEITRVIWDPNGEKVAFITKSNELIILDYSGKEIYRRHLEKSISKILWSPSGRYLAIGISRYELNREDGKIILIDVQAGKIIESDKIDGWIDNILWNPDEQSILVSTKKYNEKIYRYMSKLYYFNRNANLIWQKGYFDSEISIISWINEGKNILIAIDCPVCEIVVLNRAGDVIRSWKFVEDEKAENISYSRFSLSPNKKYLAISYRLIKDYDLVTKFIMFDTYSGKVIWKIDELGHCGEYIITSISWSPDSKYIAIGIGCRKQINRDTIRKSNKLGKIFIFSYSGNHILELDDLNDYVHKISWSPNKRYMMVSTISQKNILIYNLGVNWSTLCSSISELYEDLCSGRWLKALGKYDLLKSCGYLRDTNIYELGLLGISSLVDLRLLGSLSNKFIDVYVNILIYNLYNGGSKFTVYEVSKFTHIIINFLNRLGGLVNKKVLSNTSYFANKILGELNGKSLAEACEYLEDIVNSLSSASELNSRLRDYVQLLEDELGLDLGIKNCSVIDDPSGIEEFIKHCEKLLLKYSGIYERVSNAVESGVDLEYLRGCLNSIGGHGSILDDIEYCIGFFSRQPKVRVSIDAGKLNIGIWGKILLHIANSERFPLEVSSVTISRGFEVGRVEGCRCDGGDECSVSIYVKPVEGGVVPTKLVLEGRVLGVDREFRVEVPVELHVSPVASPVKRVAGSEISVYMVSGLPGLDELFSSILRGFVDFVPGGRSYRVMWRENYTVGWTYDGSMDCIRLGCGGWGCSYLCRGVFGEAVLKVPLGFESIIESGGGDTPTASPRILKRIKDLAETLMALKHPGIIRILGYGSRAPVLVYEYADQGTLAYQLDRGWRPALRDILLIGLQLSDALRYIHSRGLVHGDIKPGNVFVKKGIVKVGDFSSLTRLLSRTSRRSRLTSCTPGYCAPEQLFIDLKAKAKEYGVENRVDVYQLGNLLLELMGLDPIDGSEILDTDLETTLEDIPIKELKPLLLKMLSYKPWERPSVEETEKTIYKTYTKTQ